MTRNFLGRKGRNRKALFLTSTILRGRLMKDENEQGGATDDGIEVSAGFEQAAARMSGDDNRDPENQGGGATQEIEGEGEEYSQETGEDGDQPKPKRKRETSEYIKGLKRDARDLRRANSALEQRLAALENSRLQPVNSGDNNQQERAAPDATDAKKYPLGVLDDAYIDDMIDFRAGQKVAEALNNQRQSEKAQADRANAEQHATALREKLGNLIDQGSEQFEDFEEEVVETGLRGDWNLTETTFTAAAEATNGAAILHALANDKKEADRVSKLSPFQQMKYVAEQDAAIEAKKPKPRTKPAAGAPPPNGAPAGRSSSAPIRADTDNLDDFRKLFYQNK